MILKNLKLFGLLIIVASATILACKDDFTEGDFLKLQNEQAKEKEKRDSAYLATMSQEQAESYIAAQNEIGDLMSVTVLVREDNTPVAGVSVSLASGSSATESGRTKDIVTVVTDAAGRAVFERATIGDNVISLSKANYVSASARVDFGDAPTPTEITTSINGTTVKRYVAPPKRFENFSLPLYSQSASEGNTAVIQGTFSIQNDLTNAPTLPDPIPAGLVVAADLSTALLAEGDITSSCGCVLDYRFSGTAGSLGVAAINPATGAFSMRVPATADGMSVSMIYPTVVGTQRIAVRRLNNVDLPEPQYRQVPVRWDPATATATGNIPVIPGARAVFSYIGSNGLPSTTPAPAGRGFTITNFTPVARPLDAGAVSATGNTTLTNTTYRIVSRGSGYTGTPTVQITGGGSGATATAIVRTAVPALSITSGGSGFTPGVAYDIQLVFDNGIATVQIGTIQDVIAVTGNALPLGALTLPNIAGFQNNAFELPNAFSQLRFRVRNGDGSALAPGIVEPTFNIAPPTELSSITITNGGSGYTTAPTIAITGGGSTNQASVVVPAFKTQFDFSLPGVGANTAYRVLPANIRFTYPTINYTIGDNSQVVVESQVVENNGLVDMINPVGVVAVNAANILSHVTTDGTNIIPLNTAHTFRTDRAWTSPPQVSVVDRTIQAAVANLSVDAVTGAVTFNNPADLAEVAGVDFLNPNTNNTVTGQGYDGISVQVVPTIADAPGSGAMFSLNTDPQNVNTKVVVWDGTTTRLALGSGYLPNLNQTSAAQDYSGTTSLINVQTGRVYNLTINAGTGVRLETINN